MQEPLQLPVAGWIVGSVHGLLVLAEELSAFALRQVPENHLGIVGILSLDKLSDHDANPTPRAGH